MTNTQTVILKKSDYEIAKVTYARILVEIISVIAEHRNENQTAIGKIMGSHPSEWSRKICSKGAVLTLNQLIDYSTFVKIPTSVLFHVMDLVIGRHYLNLEIVQKEKEVSLDQQPEIQAIMRETIRTEIHKHTGWQNIE